MSNEELLKYSQNTKAIATFLLKQLDIINILSKYGNPLIIGSYELNLMFDKDIDIVVESNNPKNSATIILEKLIKKEVAQKYQFGDFVKFPRKNRPEGYIINLFIVHENLNWEIEIWFFCDIKNYIEQLEKYKKLVTDKHKIQILRKKYLRFLEGKTKFQKSSFEIYNDVLNI
jgi:hypothetical protein